MGYSARTSTKRGFRRLPQESEVRRCSVVIDGEVAEATAVVILQDSVSLMETKAELQLFEGEAA